MSDPKAQGGAEFMEARQRMVQVLTAAKDGDVIELKKLCKQLKRSAGGSAANVLSGYKDGNGRTCFHFAAFEGREQVCEYILSEAGDSATAWQDDNGATPLHLAVMGEQDGTVRLLLERGANPNGSSAAAVSPLHHAAGAGNLEIVARLLEAGADVNRLAPSGTPLHWAAGGGHEETVGVLVRAGADVNAISEEGMTATIAAAAKGCTAAVRCLIDAGADLSVASNEPAGQLTVLHLAAETGVLAMVEAVLATAEGRASANATNSDGLRPIQCAAATGHEDVVRLLLPHTDLSAIPAHDGGDGATGAETGASEQDAVARLMWQERHRWMQIKQARAAAVPAPAPTRQPLPTPAAATPAALEEATRLKAKGNRMFVSKQFGEADEAYTRALALHAADATFWCNRSACRLALGDAEQALVDALTARSLKPDWSKANYRAGMAYMALHMYEEAATVLWEGVMADNANKELMRAFREAIDKGRVQHAQKQKQEAEGQGSS